MLAMEYKDRQIRIVLFSGGRGTCAISKFLLDRLHIRLTVAINAYDDGLSTGRLRNFIPGMLGPSDLRKNISVLSYAGDEAGKRLKWLFEMRFPTDMDREQILACLRAIAAMAPDQCSIPEMAGALVALNFRTLCELAADLRAFLELQDRREAEGTCFDYADCSLGNLIFSGRYLRVGQNFNVTCEEIARLCSCRAEVLNVTDGMNLVLTALKEDGTYLPRESDIVSPQKTPAPISELFLLPAYLADEQNAELDAMKNLEEKIAFLRSLEVFPSLNPVLLERLAEADMIIYGPGTQHSSLMPSYVTLGLAEAVRANSRAVKAFICNIAKDNDIEQESVDTLLNKFVFYSARKGALADTSHPLEGLITHAFLQQEAGEDHVHLHYFRQKRDNETGDTRQLRDVLGLDEIYARDWEGLPGKHHGDLIGRELLSLLEFQSGLEDRQSGSHLLSIIVPALDEERTVESVLRQLLAEDMSMIGVRKEVILVDGGSSDATASIAENIDGVRVVRLSDSSGYGDALRAGFEACRGSIVATFPADGEYSTSDIEQVARPVLGGDSEVCFGSRVMKCFNYDDALKRIYEGHTGLYLMGKYGGLLLSVASFWRQGQFLSDPLTQLRVFNYDFLRRLSLSESNFGIVGEIVGKTCACQKRIFEVPVSFTPRGKAEGKKMNARHGLEVLRSLLTRRQV